MKTIIFVGVIVLLAQATNVQNEMAASLADLGEHPFGKSMVSLLSMNMKTGRAGEWKSGTVCEQAVRCTS